ncbi:MAG TPA: DUF3662 and FHA domain-containing protein [Thermomicrobiales bacterium]|nr:DUF3662 and FHA domain-containing protein [Thermomicrobiales bacterium]HRA32103.1 DUF3662 and FHA domain-containing protein [Thermomicrobiales bacterium]
MTALDKFENFFEQVVEGTVGRIFRPAIQPAEIGRRLERAMESRKVASVDGMIVPNDYRVSMNPLDMVMFADFVPALCHQMEEWLIDQADRRDYRFIDLVRVQIFGEDIVVRRQIRVDASIAELPGLDRVAQDEIQRTEVYRVIRAAGDVPPKLLRFTGGNHSGETVILRRPLIQIGRALDNDVVIDAAEVSRHHAQIEVRDGVYELRDLESTNGTQVNGRPIATARLRDGDMITFGTVAMELLPYSTPSSGMSRD